MVGRVICVEEAGLFQRVSTVFAGVSRRGEFGEVTPFSEKAVESPASLPHVVVLVALVFVPGLLFKGRQVR